MRVRFNYSSIGDTIGISAAAEAYYKKFNKPLEVVSKLPELFINNPHTISLNFNNASDSDLVLNPCRTYACNIVKNFLDQLTLTSDNLKPSLYLSEKEINFGKIILDKFSNKKYRICICLNGAIDTTSLRYEIFSSFLKKLKDSIDCYLFLIGKVNVPINDTNNLFDLQIYNTTIRECASIISNCNLYLGVDTGLWHVAAAVNIPQVVFFRNNGCSFNSYSNTYYHDSTIKCSGVCVIPSCYSCGHENRCMDFFNFNEYLETIKNILK